MSGQIPLLDSDMKTALDLLHFFQEKAKHHGRLDRGRFDAEIVDRFASHNIEVEVKWEAPVADDAEHTMMAYVPQDGDVLCPTIEIVGLIHKVEFDHERMAHEVTHDVLGLGEADSHVIKTGTADEARLIRGVEEGHRRAMGGSHGDHDGHQH